MKQLLTKWTIFTLLTLGLFSCSKDENKITFLGGDAPVLSANRSGIIPLTFLTRDQEAIRFDWTNPNYKFSTGVSSQDVNYILEFDTTGSGFTTPNMKRVAISKELSASFTQSQINDFMLNQLNLSTGVTYNLQIRVIASLNNDNGKVISNTLSFEATPYAIPPKVAPPSGGELFMVGSATPGGWNNPVPVPGQKFTQITPTLYELVVDITGGNSYLFLPINGFWGAKYG
ncbi:MAG: hypothetical protein RIR96_1373, partial [Bacteroidota bacterium]